MDKQHPQTIEQRDTFASLSEPSKEEQDAFFQALEDVYSTVQKPVRRLVRFNLNGMGAMKLAHDGNRDLTHHMDGVPELKWALYRAGPPGQNVRFTVCWAGGLATHLDMLKALTTVFPDVVYIEKFAWQADARDSNGCPTFSSTSQKEIADILAEYATPR